MWILLFVCLRAGAALPEDLPEELVASPEPERRERVAELAEACSDPDEKNRLAALGKTLEALEGTDRPEGEVLDLLEAALHPDPAVRAHAFRSARDGGPPPTVIREAEPVPTSPGSGGPEAPDAAGGAVAAGSDEPGLAPLAFSRLLIKVDDWILGELDEAGRQFIYDRLREAELEVVGNEHAVFGVDHSHEARFVLGGTLTRASVRSRSLFTELEIEVEWELLDPYTEQVVYTAATTGYAAASLKQPDRDLGWEVLEDAVLRLAEREPLRELLASQGPARPQPEETSWEPLSMRRCDSPTAPLPKGLEQAADAAATIVASGGRSGSGVVVSPDGYALTAAHVVEGDDEVEVVMRSGPRLTSRLVRIRSDLDVALVKLPGTGFPCLPVHTERPPLGADVFAIGSPLGESFEVSVSRGIVSGFREVEGQRYLQTDAAVNPGSSGGPILDEEGRVTALTAWKIAGGAEGMGFGIPAGSVLEGLALELGERSSPLPDRPPVVGGTVAALQAVNDARDASRLGTLSPTVDEEVRSTAYGVIGTGGGLTAVGLAMIGGSYAGFVNNEAKTQEQLTTLNAVNGGGWATAAVGASIAAWGVKMLAER